MTDEELEAWTVQRIIDVQNYFRRLSLDQRMEYFDAIAAQIVMKCADIHDTKWPANLHLADVLEKHLLRLIPPCLAIVPETWRTPTVREIQIMGNAAIEADGRPIEQGPTPNITFTPRP